MEQLTTVAVSAAERAAGLPPEKLAAALEALRADGIVCLGQAIDPRCIDRLREAMHADMRADDQPEKVLSTMRPGSWGSLRPPPRRPHLFREIVYNEPGVAVSCEYLGDDSAPTLTTYGANSSYPGAAEPQNTHRDCPADEPRGDACPGLVVNVPLQDFTIQNGATQVFLGSHLLPGPPAQVAALGREARTIARQGDLLLRDLRLAVSAARLPRTSS